MKWLEISKEEFYATVGQLNVHPEIQNPYYPYWKLWEMQDGTKKVVGKTADKRVWGRICTRYYVPDTEPKEVQ